MFLTEAVKQRIQELLVEKQLTQYRLAKNACISHETIKNIMKGKCKTVNLKTLIIIASGFNLTVSEFTKSPLFDTKNYVNKVKNDT